ncbi:MAG: endonuclease/exonuclease/phosphatase family protein [Anaerolineae bacterium]
MVAFQEMNWQAADGFDSQLPDVYPYRLFYHEPNDNPYHGRGLLSRYPILEEQSTPAEYPIPLRLQRVVMDVDGVSVTIFNFHAPPSYPIYGQGFDIQPRSQQITDLVEEAGQTQGAVLLMGDFNTDDLDVNYPRISASFSDSYWEVGWGLGFTGPDWSHPQSQEGLPFIPIHQRADYIFHNDAFTALEARVWPDSGGSDHRPLYAVLGIVNNQ